MPRSDAYRLTILIADDHRAVRAGVKAILEGKNFQVLEASDGSEALGLCRHLQPDVVLLDLSMPSMHGLEVARQVGRSCPETRVIMLSAHREEQYVRESLRAGASGYVAKNSIVVGLIQAIEAVCRGETYITPGILGPAPADEQKAEAHRF